MRLQRFELVALAAMGLFAATARAEVSGSFQLTEVAPGVHVAIRPDPLAHPVEGNVTLLIGDEDVVVIDSCRTPASAAEIIADIRKLTPLPVRYLINTHWHGDHHHGNATYQSAFPGIEIIAQRATREDIETLGERSLKGQIDLFSNRAALEGYLSSGLDGRGHPLVDAQKHRIRQLLSVPESYLEELRAVRLTPPNLVFEHELRLYQGDREIRIFSNGAGNTRGDAVIYLPREKIVVTGDLLVATVPFMSMSYPHGWLARLDEIAALDFDLLVPGHGPVQRDRHLLDLHRELLRSLLEQVDRATRDGASLEETVARVDLSRFREAYSKGDPFLADEFDYRVGHPAPRDAYLEATSARASDLGSDVAAEAARLVALVPEEGRPEFLANDLASAIDSLGEVSSDVSMGRVDLALRKLARNQDMVESAAFFLEHAETAQDPAKFEALWTEVGPGLAQEARELDDAFEGRSAAVRAQGEIAQNGILTHYRAARLYGKAGMHAGGLFYLGSAEAAAKRARLCTSLHDAPMGDAPRFNALADVEASLSKLALDAYAEGEAATTHHGDFIVLDAALKQARELLRDGHSFGAAALLLEARLRLGVAKAPENATPDFEGVSYRARLFDPNHDHSLARTFWERALAGAASSDAEEHRVAAVIVAEVLPFYFDEILDSPKG